MVRATLSIIILLGLLFYAIVKSGDIIRKGAGGKSESGPVDTIPASPHIGYHPEKWNCNSNSNSNNNSQSKKDGGDNCNIQHSHNCYTYVLDDQNPDTIDECTSRKKKG